MPEKPDNLYGTFGSVPDNVSVNGTGSQGMRVQATSEDFGGEIGSSLEKAGARAQKFGDEALSTATNFARMATEAKVNDDFANKYAPAAADLRAQYDGLRGQDKIAGYESYLKNLQSLNSQFLTNSPSPLYQQMMGSSVDRHVANEIESSRRELVESQKQFSDESYLSKIQTDANYAAQNYNNPKIVDQVEGSIRGTAALQADTQGYNLADPSHAAAVESIANDHVGNMAVGMVNSAVNRGDAPAANKIREKYGPFIPGYQQLPLDRTLHTENIRQTSAQAIPALTSGQPLPPTVGAPPAVVQAKVADAAQSGNVDHNLALTVLRIESSYGQNVGKRGTIGQTPTGGPLEQQAGDMIAAIKKAETQAQAALGRTPTPDEIYTCYQQGAGGGPALLKATIDNPNAKAVDVLKPLYKNPQDAISAITHNGGNVTMTSGDFLNFIKQKYSDNEKRARCEIPSFNGGEAAPEVGGMSVAPTSLGAAIMAPHEEVGPVVQPAASPRQALDNFDEKAPDIIARISAIPNVEVREGVMKAYNKQRDMLASASTAYSHQLVGKAQKLANDPSFTSMDQVPPDMASSLLAEHPDTMHYLELRAEENLTKGSGGITKDMKEYGPETFNLLRQIHSGEIKSTDQLAAYLPGGPKAGGLTLAGYDRLTKEFTHDPESQSDAMMKTQAFKVIKRQLSGQDEEFGIPDPKGEELFSQALPKLFKAIDDGKAKGLTMGELTDPTSPNWIGNTVQSLKRSQTQMAIDMGIDTDDKAATKKERQFADIYKEYKAATDPNKKAALKKEAEDLGFVRKSAPKILAPVSE